jgi:hypothetical protein
LENISEVHIQNAFLLPCSVCQRPVASGATSRALNFRKVKSLWKELTERGGGSDVGCLFQKWLHGVWYGALLWCNFVMVECYGAVMVEFYGAMSWWNVTV